MVKTPEVIHAGVPSVHRGTSTEVAVVASQEAVLQEVQGAIMVAQRFKRDEDLAYQRLMKSCDRPSFAEDVEYSYPRGGQTISGASIYFAREAARVFGNIRHGGEIIHDDEMTRVIQAWAWDMENNTKSVAQDSFKKVVQRKDHKSGVTSWVTPDERDLRELTNNRMARLKRNCILELIPPDWIDEARQRARQTIEKKIKDDPDATRKMLLNAFAVLNVGADQLKQFLGCAISNASPAQLAELRNMYAAIRDGQATWQDYVDAPDDPGSAKDQVKEKLKKQRAKKETQGDGNKPPEQPPAEKPPEKPPEPAKADSSPPPTAGKPTDMIRPDQSKTLLDLMNVSDAAKEMGKKQIERWGLASFDDMNQGAADQLIEMLKGGKK
jgi:uncharacterized protein YbaA (DUF1428 family)